MVNEEQVSMSTTEETRICNDCKGSGKSRNGPDLNCEYCGGSGRIETYASRQRRAPAPQPAQDAGEEWRVEAMRLGDEMKTIDEIHDMIATAHTGDGDKMLDICQALLEQLRKVSRQVEVLDFSKVDVPRGTSRFAHGEDLERLRERFIAAECIGGHVVSAAGAMDLDAFEKALCPVLTNDKRCCATLTIYRKQVAQV